MKYLMQKYLMGSRDTWPSLHLPDLGVNCAARWGLWAAVPACVTSLGGDLPLQRCPGMGHRCLYSHGTPGLAAPHKSECEVKGRLYEPTQTQGEGKQQMVSEILCVTALGYWEV